MSLPSHIFRIRLGFILPLFLCVIAYSQTIGEPDLIYLSIVISKLKLSEKGSVKINIALVNDSENDIHFIRGYDRDDFEIEIKDENNKIISLTKDAAARKEFPKTGSYYLVCLKPSEKFNFEIDLSELYDLSQGKYTISLNRGGLKKDKSTTFTARMKPTEISIISAY